MMRSLGFNLACRGWVLRSGCAQGADSAFEDGAFDAYFAHSAHVPKPELYLPWPKYEGRYRSVTKRDEPQEEAFPVAAHFHPAWTSCSQGAQKLHARNVHQVLGYDVNYPALSSFIVCWTPGGAGGGGTGQALRIAQHYGVTVYDLARPEILELVLATPEFGFC